MRRAVRPHAGFTLVEVIAVGGLIAAILGMAAVILLASLNGFARSAQRDEARQLCLSVYELYRSQLVSARDVSVNTGEGGRMLSINDGKVYYAPEDSFLEPLYPEAMYSGCEIRVLLSGAGDCFSLRVEVRSGDDLLFYKESSFKPLTLNRTGRLAEWPPGMHGPLLNPDIRLY